MLPKQDTFYRKAGHFLLDASSQNVDNFLAGQFDIVCPFVIMLSGGVAYGKNHRCTRFSRLQG